MKGPWQRKREREAKPNTLSYIRAFLTSDMDRAHYSNCHYWAWGHFVKNGGYMCMRRSYFGKLEVKDTPELYWVPFWIIGVALQHVGSWITFLGWMFRWRTWYHMVWIPKIEEDYYEFNPLTKKGMRKVAPGIFYGRATIGSDKDIDPKVERYEQVFLLGNALQDTKSED